LPDELTPQDAVSVDDRRRAGQWSRRRGASVHRIIGLGRVAHCGPHAAGPSWPWSCPTSTDRYWPMLRPEPTFPRKRDSS